jgi:hypothetical protein
MVGSRRSRKSGRRIRAGGVRCGLSAASLAAKTHAGEATRARDKSQEGQNEASTNVLISFLMLRAMGIRMIGIAKVNQKSHLSPSVESLWYGTPHSCKVASSMLAPWSGLTSASLTSLRPTEDLSDETYILGMWLGRLMK